VKKRGVLSGLLLAGVAVMALSACRHRAALSDLLEARRLASELHVEFTKASEAANRAVMADTDEASVTAADQARRARQIVERDLEALRPILRSLGYRTDIGYLDIFKTRFDEYRRLDDEILPLAVENTNLKAQRLSFGPAREAADALGPPSMLRLRQARRISAPPRPWRRRHASRCSKSRPCKLPTSRKPKMPR
jgi:hypothetical protein